ncbi:MAG: DUF3343 domain-containing protein [Candidatus Eisenbacteria bacterium]|nr:DUF3343 domain-containing protein [Candidatus Latescibacterota bacterium]MBD3302662.1 DUF3343 domain-containing protein [Candidatus Eisenbacteria bacterium]
MTTPTECRGLVLCDSIHHVLALEKRLRAADVPIDLIPVPRALSSDCGVAIAFALDALDPVRRILAEPGVRWRGLFRRDGDDWREAEPV